MSVRERVRRRVREADATLPRTDGVLPLHLIVEPTNVCNLACVMCPSSRQRRARGAG